MKMKNKISKVVDLIPAIGTVVAFAFPFVSLAQNVYGNGPAPTVLPTNVTNVQGITGMFCNIAAWVFIVLMVLAVIYVLWAAFLYLTGSGDEEKIKKANHQLLYAAIAIAIMLIARVFPAVIASMFGATGAWRCGQ